MMEQAHSVDEIQQMVKGGGKWLPCGGRSKARLCSVADSFALLDMRQIQGIIEYDPGEYTFTAYAGTPIRDIQMALAENGQYLPFDPLLVEQGATLGGTTAANTSGSGRWRYGGIRDFILGVRFVDGRGQLIRSGGKVVKNAAGFDLHKFLVGSLGRYGILTELSFKVFPRPHAYRTIQARFDSVPHALHMLRRLATSSLEADAIDLVPQADAALLLIRVGGLENMLEARLRRWQDLFARETPAPHVSILDDDRSLWQDMNALSWCAEGKTVCKVPIAPGQIEQMEQRLQGLEPARRYIAAGNILWIACDATVPLDAILTEMRLSGLVIRGQSSAPIIGHRQAESFARKVRQVLDPDNIFAED